MFFKPNDRRKLLRLFSIKPTGNERIIGEYKPSLKSLNNQTPPFQSEWGKTPEQAAQVREFMLGVAEVISGVFCVAVTSRLGLSVGSVALGDGVFRIYTSLNNIWAGHQAMLELKKWEQLNLKAVESE